MANPTLTIEIKQKGAEGVTSTLKQIEKQGNTTYTKILKDGQLVSEQTRTITGQQKLNYSAITALNQGYSLLSSVIASVKGPMEEMLKLALDDEDSLTRRNTAVLKLVGATEQDIQTLENQVKQFQRTTGVADDYTRSIQAQLAAQGLNKDMIDDATRATIGLAHVTGQDAVTAAKAMARFLDGTSNSLRGTTVEVDKNTDAQGRLTEAMKVAGVGLSQLSDEADTNAGRVRLANDAWSELKESVGRLFTAEPAMKELQKLTGGLNGLSDWIDAHQSQLGALREWLQAAGMGIATGGASFMLQGAKTARTMVHGRGEINYMAGTRAFQPGANIGAGMARFSGGASGGPSTPWYQSRGAGNAAGLIGGYMGGGFGGLLSAAGGMFGGPLGALAGGLVGKLFGGHHKQRGETPAQPLYTQDVKLGSLLTDLLNITKIAAIRGASGGIDANIRALNTANARAGI